MSYRYESNPTLTAAQVGELREAVGWDARIEKYQEILGNTYLCVACFNGDELVGYADVVSDGVDDAYIRDLMVRPEHQHQGIASILIAMIVETVKGDGIKMVGALFGPDCAEFFRRAGFYIMAGGVIDFEI